MKTILLRMEELLGDLLNLVKTEVTERRTEKWLDTSTTKFILDKGERSLYNYVKQGLLETKKVGGLNVYSEASVKRVLDQQTVQNLPRKIVSL